MPNRYLVSPMLSKTCALCDWKASVYIELKDRERIALCERHSESHYEQVTKLTLREFEVWRVMNA